MADVPLRRPGTTTAIWVTRIVLVGVLVLILVLLAKGGMFTGAAWNSDKEKVRMPVSKSRIVPGQTIEAAHVGYVEIPMSELKEEYLIDDKDIIGRVAKQEIPVSKAFRDAWMHPRDSKPVKPPTPPVTTINKGWVVVTIDASKVDAPFDLLRPGTSVVVLATRDIEGAPSKVSVVTRKAQIMSVSLDSASSRKGVPAGESGIVLQMPSEEAIKFVQVQKTSTFTLVIVNRGQEDELKLPGEGEFNPKDSIEVIRGSKRTFEVPGKKPEGNEPE